MALGTGANWSVQPNCQTFESTRLMPISGRGLAGLRTRKPTATRMTRPSDLGLGRRTRRRRIAARAMPVCRQTVAKKRQHRRQRLSVGALTVPSLFSMTGQSVRFRRYCSTHRHVHIGSMLELSDYRDWIGLDKPFVRPTPLAASDVPAAVDTLCQTFVREPRRTPFQVRKGLSPRELLPLLISRDPLPIPSAVMDLLDRLWPWNVQRRTVTQTALPPRGLCGRETSPNCRSVRL